MKHQTRLRWAKPRHALPNCQEEKPEHAVAVLVLICECSKPFVTPLKCHTKYRRGRQVWCAFQMGSGEVMTQIHMNGDQLRWKNNCNAARKFNVAKADKWRWRQQRQKLINANSTQAWTFPNIRARKWVCALEEKNRSANYKTMK